MTKGFLLIQEKVLGWMEAAVKMLPNLIVASLVVLAAFVLGRIVQMSSKNLFYRLSDNKAAARFIAGFLKVAVITVGLFFALSILRLDKTVMSLLAGAGVVGLALGFAFQEIASNFIAGVLIAFMKPFEVGDIVEVDHYSGEIKTINLRCTVLTTFEGLEVMIPNKTMYTSSLTNYTSTPLRRVDLNVGVSYGEDLRRVREITMNALAEVPYRFQKRDIELFFKEFGDSSINFEARVWIDRADQISYLAALNEMVLRIKEAYNANDITIPFPIRTLDFGIKGGQTLAQVLPRSPEKR